MDHQKIDYLKEDPVITGQEVALISFVEPQEKRLLKNRESFFATRFLKGFIEEYKIAVENTTKNPDMEITPEIQEKLDISYENIKSRYYDFLKFNLSELDQEFDKNHNENKVPTVTGFKVRGTYPTQLVTKGKARELQALEPAINVYCVPVGKWIPYCPLNEQQVESEYQEEQLNEILKKKEDDHVKQELEFNQRKMALQRKAEEQKLETINEDEEVKVEEIIDELQKEPIIPQKKEKKTKKEKKEKKIKSKPKGKRGRPRKSRN